MQIRIIAGKYKNKRLHISLLPHTRPSKAIIREAVFNTLGNLICNKSFLEAFGGCLLYTSDAADDPRTV